MPFASIEPMAGAQTEVWQAHAKQWRLVGAPLRPSPEDGDLVLELLAGVLSGQGQQARVAVLGVTPELVQLNWPEQTSVHAFDHALHMLESVWKPHPSVSSRVSLAQWQALPVPSEYFHAVVGDGSLNALPTLEACGAVFEELARVTLPSAVVVIRCFVRPEVPESLEQIKDAVQAGQVRSFHALKWRMAMSLAAQDGGGAVAVQAIHAAFERLFDRAALLAQTGWPNEVVGTIDAYGMADTVYTFPTLTQLRERCAPHWWLDAPRYATYELADRCPTLRFRRKGCLV